MIIYLLKSTVSLVRLKFPHIDNISHIIHESKHSLSNIKCLQLLSTSPTSASTSVNANGSSSLSNSLSSDSHSLPETDISNCSNLVSTDYIFMDSSTSFTADIGSSSFAFPGGEACSPGGEVEPLIEKKGVDTIPEVEGCVESDAHALMLAQSSENDVNVSVAESRATATLSPGAESQQSKDPILSSKQAEKKQSRSLKLVNDGCCARFHNTLFSTIFLLIPSLIGTSVKHGVCGLGGAMKNMFTCCCPGKRKGSKNRKAKNIADQQSDDHNQGSQTETRDDPVVHVYLPASCGSRKETVSMRDLRQYLRDYDKAATQAPCCAGETGTIHGFFVETIRGIIKWVKIDMKSPTSIKVVRFFTDLSIVNFPILGRILIPHKNETVRFVRKTGVDSREKTQDKNQWAYVLFKKSDISSFWKWWEGGAGGEKSGFCKRRKFGRNQQMLEWKLFKKGSRAVDAKTKEAETSATPILSRRKSHDALGQPPNQPNQEHIFPETIPVDVDSPLQTLQKSERVIFYTHGGAFMSCSADMALSTMMYDIIHISNAALYACNYRRPPDENVDLATTTIDDVLAEYKYLISVLGVDAKNVIVCGESAGAALTLQLLVRLREEGSAGEVDMMPSSAVLMSPWCDLSDRGLNMKSMKTNAKKDMIGSNTVVLISEGVGGERDRTDPGVSVIYNFEGKELHGDKHGGKHGGKQTGLLPPLFISAGLLEVLRDSIVELVDRLEGESVELHFQLHNMVHAGQIFAQCHEPSSIAMDNTAEFIKEKGGAGKVGV